MITLIEKQVYLVLRVNILKIKPKYRVSAISIVPNDKNDKDCAKLSNNLLGVNTTTIIKKEYLSLKIQLIRPYPKYFTDHEKE